MLVFFINPIGAAEVFKKLTRGVSHSQIRWRGVTQGGVDPVFPTSWMVFFLDGLEGSRRPGRIHEDVQDRGDHSESRCLNLDALVSRLRFLCMLFGG